MRGGDGRGCSVSPWRSQHCPLRHLCVTSSPRRQELLESRAGPNEKSPGVTGASCAASSSRVWRIVIFRRLRRKTDSSNTAASMSDRCDIFAAPLFPFPRSLSEIAMRGYCAFRACALCATRSVNLNRVLPANRNCASSEVGKAPIRDFARPRRIRGESYCCTAVTSNRMCAEIRIVYFLNPDLCATTHS